MTLDKRVKALEGATGERPYGLWGFLDIDGSVVCEGRKMTEAEFDALAAARGVRGVLVAYDTEVQDNERQLEC